MKINQCKYVCASDLFEGQPDAWSAFFESDPDCSWGSNNRTLLSRDFMLSVLDDLDADDIEVVTKRLEALEADVYIDLEN